MAKTWKQLKSLLLDDWIDKMWYIDTMKYYSVITKDQILPVETTWMDPENITLTEISQTEKKNNMISLICAI